MAKTGFAQQVDQFKSDLTGPARKAAFAAFARDMRNEAQRQDRDIVGHDVAVVTVVDGRAGASEDDVKLPGGTIVYLFDVGASLLERAVDECAALLLEMSPFRAKRPNADPPTHYRDTHRMLVNGTETSAALAGHAIDLKESDIVTFVNLQPYARKIERGWSSDAPNGVYEAAASVLRSHYDRATVRVEFSYQRYPGFSVGKPRSSREKESHRTEQYPTIGISLAPAA